MSEIIFHNGFKNLTPWGDAPLYFESFLEEGQPFMSYPNASSNPGSYIYTLGMYWNNQAPEYPTGDNWQFPVFTFSITNKNLQDANFNTGNLQFCCVEGSMRTESGGTITVEDVYLLGGLHISQHITSGQNSYSGDCIFYLAKTPSFDTAYTDSTKVIDTILSTGVSLSSLTGNTARNKINVGLYFYRRYYDADRNPVDYATKWLNYDLTIAVYNPRRNATDIDTHYMLFTKQSSGALNNADSSHAFKRIDSYLLFTQRGVVFSIEEYSEEVGEPSTTGGYGGGPGSFNRDSDSIAVPPVPAMGALGTGFYHAYAPDISDLSGIGAELLPRLNFTPPTPVQTGLSVADAIINGVNNSMAWLANVPAMVENSQKARMIDYVLDCHLLPVEPIKGSRQNIIVGWQTLPQDAPVVTSDYVYYSLGEILLYEFYECFADYLSRARLFIPFVGFVSCQPEWFNNTALSLEYWFNIIDGSFTAYLSGRPISDKHTHLMSKTILGQWGGSCCVHIPITGINYASMMSGAIGGAGGAVMAAGSGNLVGAATSAINAISARGTVEQSNSYSASAAFMGGRQAYIMIERPVSSWSKSYAHEIGIPANVTARLGDVTGFAKITDIHLDGISATDAEKNEIERLLADGVIL